MVELSRRAVSMDSEIERHSRTGRPTFHASAAASGSIFTEALPPKPPPTKGTMTRTRASGTPKISDTTFCTAPGDWAQLHNVKSCPSQAATTQCGSNA